MTENFPNWMQNINLSIKKHNEFKGGEMQRDPLLGTSESNC